MADRADDELDLMEALAQSIERARARRRRREAATKKVDPINRSDEASEHVDQTGHQVEYREEFGLWACWECPWVDSAYVVTREGNEG